MDILPIAQETSNQTIFISTTGIEKIFTWIGITTVIVLALLGLVTIIVRAFKRGK